MINRNLDELKIQYESLIPMGAKFRPGTKIEKPGKLGMPLTGRQICGRKNGEIKHKGGKNVINK